MRLQRGQIPQLSRQIVGALVGGEHIEVADRREVERDIEGVLSQYLEDVDRVLSRARDLVQQRGLPQGEFGRIKQLAADQAGIKMGDDGLEHVQAQILQMLFHSGNVEEVFSDDHQIKRIIRDLVRDDEAGDVQIEAEVRSKLKHVQEGSRLWEIEYERMKADIKRRRG
jgi:hypothetical protein